VKPHPARWRLSSRAVPLAACIASACANPHPGPDPADATQNDDPAEATLELQAHLFMKEGMGFLAQGDFFDKALWVKDGTSKLGAQANALTVERSGIGILVVSLYAHLRSLTRGRALSADSSTWSIASWRDTKEAQGARGNG
jgi:hypothetical protein